MVTAMQRTPFVHPVLAFFGLAAVALLGACESTKPASAETPQTAKETTPAANAPKRAEITDEFTATAEVVAVAPADRLITLRREDGAQFTVRAGEAVRNFDQIAVGDTLRVRYKATFAAERGAPGEKAEPAVAALAAGRAKKGERPGAGVGLGVRVNVKIESIDAARDIVVFSLASGELIAHRIRTAQGREFVAGLKVGDVVQLDYSEVLAVTVEKV